MPKKCPSGFKAPEAALLLAIINNHPPFHFDNADLTTFLELVKIHGVAPLVFYRQIDRGLNIPNGGYASLKSEYLDSIHSNMGLWTAFLKIEEAFKLQNVRLLPLEKAWEVVNWHERIAQVSGKI